MTKAFIFKIVSLKNYFNPSFPSSTSCRLSVETLFLVLDLKILFWDSTDGLTVDLQLIWQVPVL